MKRSEANEIYENLLLFTAVYDCFSVEEDKENGCDKEAYFSSHGCEICHQGAGTVLPMEALEVEKIEKKNFNDVIQFEACNSCACFLFNNDSSFLDYYVTDEDTTDLREEMKNLRITKSHWHYIDQEENEISLDSNENEEKYFFYFGLPGCLPDSEFFGPYDSLKEALEAALEFLI
jgi:hypothetical protein